MAEYKALTFLHLPDPKDLEGGVRKSPGDTITGKELEAAGQTDDNIKQLLKSGAISDDMDADIDEAHKGVEISAPDGSEHIVAADGGKGK